MKRAVILAIAVALAATFLGTSRRPIEAQPAPAVREQGVERPREPPRQEIQIRRARGVTRRILRDRRASPEMQRQATELDEILEKRQALLQSLEKRHIDFLAQHKAEIDELQDLGQRARELERRLNTARSSVLDAGANDVAAIKETSAHAVKLAEELRAAYLGQRRENRGRRR